ARLRPLDGDLERQQVRLAMRSWIDERVQPVPIRLVAVERVVLDRRDHTLTLDRVDRLRDEASAEPRILGDILEVAAVAWVAGEGEAAGELNVESSTPGFAAKNLPGRPGQRRIEARTQCNPGRERGRGIARPIAGVRDAQARVAHP